MSTRAYTTVASSLLTVIELQADDILNIYATRNTTEKCIKIAKNTIYTKLTNSTYSSSRDAGVAAMLLLLI